MPRKRKDGISDDERLAVEEFVKSMVDASKWIDASDKPEDEAVGIDKLGWEARTKLLKSLYEAVGENKLEQMKQIIDMSMDSDFRSPK